MLTDSQVSEFNDKGYLVIENFLDRDNVEALNREAQKLLESFDLKNHPKTKFNTTSDNQHIGDEYFLKSSTNISYFLEEAAFNEKNELTVDAPWKAVNKIGHALHKLNPAFSDITDSDRVKQITQSLGINNPYMLQSMLIFKHPKVGGEVREHQDSTFLYTDPPSAIGFWFALEDVTLENGCLWFVDGSHRLNGKSIKRRFVRNPEYFSDESLSVPKSDATGPALTFRYSKNEGETREYTEYDWIPIEMKAGSLALIHGSVLHKSQKNTSDKSRYAYTFHVIDTEAKYSKENWLQVPDLKSY